MRWNYLFFKKTRYFPENKQWVVNTVTFYKNTAIKFMIAQIEAASFFYRIMHFLWNLACVFYVEMGWQSTQQKTIHPVNIKKNFKNFFFENLVPKILDWHPSDTPIASFFNSLYSSKISKLSVFIISATILIVPSLFILSQSFVQKKLKITPFGVQNPRRGGNPRKG